MNNEQWTINDRLIYPTVARAWESSAAVW
jgi:hypothetical protein